MSLFKNAVRAWLGLPEPPKPFLWPIHRHDGALYGVITKGGDPVLALFVSPELAERFVLERGLEQHLVGSPLQPEQVARLCEASIEALSSDPEADPVDRDIAAFPYVTIFDGVNNPVPLVDEPFAYWPMAQFRAMALAADDG